jgi:hypothetical protein
MNQTRRPHQLKSNQKSEYPYRLIFFDTETNRISRGNGEFDHVLRLGWLNYLEIDPKRRNTADTWLQFFTWSEFWDFLAQKEAKKSLTLVIAQNIDFDLQVLNYLDELESRGYQILKHISNQRFILRVRRNQHTFLFLDLSNLGYKVSLKQIGQDLGLEKLDVNPLMASDPELSIYCHRDVEIVREYVVRLFSFLKGEDLGNFAPTVAGIAFNSFRHRFMTYPIFIHIHPKVISLEREAYRGGRCEAFFIGSLPDNQTYYNLDVNSMYPFVMREHDYPVRLTKFWPTGNIPLLKWALKRGAVIARVHYNISEPVMGIKKERLIFPIGSQRAVLTSPELEFLLENGEIREVFEMAMYGKAPIFRQYVDFFYNQRKEYLASGQKSYANFSKLMLNSLYGKFGQRSRSSEPISWTPQVPGRYSKYANSTTGETGIIFKTGNQWFKETTWQEGYNSLVAVPAFVTAFARMYLWNLIIQAGRDNVYYVDTDSLFVNEEGYNNLSDLISEDRELGKLSIKFSSNKLEIRGLKAYRFGESVKIKGIRHPAQFQVQFKQTQFIRTRSAMRDQIAGAVREKEVTKHLDYDYRKGYVSSSGVVRPFSSEIWASP